jgi:hypothetical protein
MGPSAGLDAFKKRKIWGLVCPSAGLDAFIKEENMGLGVPQCRSGRF